MRRRPHILVVPSPAQGHVAPLLKLSQRMTSEGIKVMFVNTEFIHRKIMASTSDQERERIGITLASIPDGLKPDDDARKDFQKFTDSIRRVMPGGLIDLIEETNNSNYDEPITCLLGDISIGWILDVAEQFGLEQVGFWPGGAAHLALSLNIPKIIAAGIVDGNGNIIRNEKISLLNGIPAWSSREFTWSFPGNAEAEKALFECGLTIKQAAERVKLILSNTSYELDSPSCDLIPNIIPIGPLLTSNHAESSCFSGSFWLEDTSCLGWLDRQEPSSVIYVAFGSLAALGQQQLDELALGLELTGRPFMWVVRAEITNGSPVVYPDGFLERVATKGKIVDWAPQEKVLAHPSIACFLSHCGWNSTLEGISVGVPFLCWPCFADQFQNQNYICDFWKVGLRLNPDENSIRSRHEISTKIEMLLSDASIKVNALKLRDLCEKKYQQKWIFFWEFGEVFQSSKALTLFLFFCSS